MRQQGRLVDWNDERGFGFVEPHGGGERCFVHVRAFSTRERRPLTGDVITYETQRDAQGRRNATAVRFAIQRGSARRTPATPRRGRDLLPRASLALLFLCGLVAAALWRQWPMWLPGAYVALSMVTFLSYWHDKSAAQHGRRRTPESTLQGLALLGGWPGALLAQSLLRHKNRKTPFQAVFWAAVALNLLALGWLASKGWQPG